MLNESYSYYYRGEKYTLKTNFSLVGLAFSNKFDIKKAKSAFSLLGKKAKLGNPLCSQPHFYPNGIVKFYTNDRDKALATYFVGLPYQEVPVFGDEYGCMGPNNGIVVRFKKKTSFGEAAALGEKHKMVLAKGETEELEQYVPRTFLFRLIGVNPESCFDVASRIWETEKEYLEYAEPDFFGKMQLSMAGITDPERNMQWALKDTVTTPRKDMRVAEAWTLIQNKVNQGGFALTVANIGVVDDGLHLHSDILSDNLLAGKNYTSSNRGETTPGGPTDNHGSQITGILAAAHNGVAMAGVNFGLANIGVPFCKVKPIRVSNNGGHFVSSSLVALGIGVAGSTTRIVNMSINFTSGFSGVATIEAAIRSYPNTLFVCSAGNFYTNNAGDRAVLPPATLSEVLTVAAHDRLGRWIGRDNGHSWGSRIGAQVDICAPGSDAAGTISQNNLSNNFSGTSAATAFVSGVAGLILAINPGLMPAAVIAIIKGNTENDITINGNPSDRANYVGAGRINAERAVAVALLGLPA